MPQLLDLADEVLLKILRFAAPAPVLRFCYPHIATAPADFGVATHRNEHKVLHGPYLDLSLVCHRISDLLKDVKQPITMHFCETTCAMIGLKRYRHPRTSPIMRIKVKTHFKYWFLAGVKEPSRRAIDEQFGATQYSLRMLLGEAWKTEYMKYWDCEDKKLDYVCKGKGIVTLTKREAGVGVTDCDPRSFSGVTKRCGDYEFSDDDSDD